MIVDSEVTTNDVNICNYVNVSSIWDNLDISDVGKFCSRHHIRTSLSLFLIRLVHPSLPVNCL